MLPAFKTALIGVAFVTCTGLVLLVSCLRPPDPASRTPSDASPTPDAAKAQTTEQSSVEYPAKPTLPAPVGLPAGQGSAVTLQRYIVVDQFGYRPELTKVAVLANPERGWNAADEYVPGDQLEVRRWNDGNAVFEGAASVWNEGAIDETAGDRGAWFDFSELREPGLYYVYDPANDVRSHPFSIADDVYADVLKAAMKMFYFNRANFEKKAPHACVGDKCWLHGPDYLGAGQDAEARSVEARLQPGTARDLSGGWWDAGDTNKYVTFSNDAFHQLLTAYQEHPAAFGDDFGIPESGNDLPDLIDEVLVEFRWLKKMQPADLDGGVILKLGNVDYGDPLPEQSEFPRFYYPKPCSSATISLASEMAHAAVVFKRFPVLAVETQDALLRAERAWNHYSKTEKNTECDDGTIKSGDADRSLEQQQATAVTAAVYLFAATRDLKYDRYVVEHHASTRPFEDDHWSVYDQSQGDALMYYTTLPAAHQQTKAAILGRKLELAKSVDYFGFEATSDLYLAYMRPSTYHWGSNNARAAIGNTNYDLVQYAVIPEAERSRFARRAEGMMHSFHGVNPMQLVYLTNMYAFGAEASADEAFHTWFRDGDPTYDNARASKLGPAPGYVTGGPNQFYCKDQDPKVHACATSPVRDQPPEKAYFDSNTAWEPGNPYDKSWEITEPAIYYQASYVRLLSKFVN
jgi:hypothetical protein